MRRLELVPLSALKEAERNPKDHDLLGISGSLARFGYVEPLVLDERTGRLVAGHGRLQTLREMAATGQEPPAGVEAGPEGWAVPVLRGWSSRDDAEAEGYLLASNRLVELGGWDEEALEELLRGLPGDVLEAAGYDAETLEVMLGETVEAAASEPALDPETGVKAVLTVAEREDSYLNSAVRTILIPLAVEDYERVIAQMASARAKLNVETNADLLKRLLDLAE